MNAIEQNQLMQSFMANMWHCIIDDKSISINGGIYSSEEIRVIYNQIKLMQYNETVKDNA